VWAIPHLAFEIGFQVLLSQQESVSRSLEPGTDERTFQERDDENSEFFRVHQSANFPLRLTGAGYLREIAHPLTHGALGPVAQGRIAGIQHRIEHGTTPGEGRPGNKTRDVTSEFVYAVWDLIEVTHSRRTSLCPGVVKSRHRQLILRGEVAVQASLLQTCGPADVLHGAAMETFPIEEGRRLGDDSLSRLFTFLHRSDPGTLSPASPMRRWGFDGPPSASKAANPLPGKF
jgi:hypothetical protein